MYFIGSQAKAAKWTNPAQLHIPMTNPLAEVVVTSSNPPDLNGGTSVCGRTMQQWNTQGDDQRGQQLSGLSHCASLYLTVPHCHCASLRLTAPHCHCASLRLSVTAPHCHCASLHLTVPHCHCASLRLTAPHCHCASLSLRLTASHCASLPLTAP